MDGKQIMIPQEEYIQLCNKVEKYEKAIEDIKAEIISQLDMYEPCVEDDIELGEIRAYKDVLDIINEHIGGGK